MNKEKKIKLALTIAIGIIAIVGIIKAVDIYYEKNNTEQISISNFIENETEDEKDNTKIKVYITGEVKNQGVIELEEGDRIADAIEKAGGQTEQASLKNVNLAYQLEDGQKIYIPNINDTETEIIDDGASGVVDDATIKQTVVNINKADEKELQSLNGIGESLATSIVQYRKENGKFETIEDLKNVPGIGDSKFENIKEYIKVK
jgi:competence protein ComEA